MVAVESPCSSREMTLYRRCFDLVAEGRTTVGLRASSACLRNLNATVMTSSEGA